MELHKLLMIATLYQAHVLCLARDQWRVFATYSDQETLGIRLDETKKTCLRPGDRLRVEVNATERFKLISTFNNKMNVPTYLDNVLAKNFSDPTSFTYKKILAITMENGGYGTVGIEMKDKKSEFQSIVHVTVIDSTQICNIEQAKGKLELPRRTTGEEKPGDSPSRLVLTLDSKNRNITCTTLTNAMPLLMRRIYCQQADYCDIIQNCLLEDCGQRFYHNSESMKSCENCTSVYLTHVEASTSFECRGVADEIREEVIAGADGKLHLTSDRLPPKEMQHIMLHNVSCNDGNSTSHSCFLCAASAYTINYNISFFVTTANNDIKTLNGIQVTPFSFGRHQYLLKVKRDANITKIRCGGFSLQSKTYVTTEILVQHPVGGDTTTDDATEGWSFVATVVVFALSVIFFAILLFLTILLYVRHVKRPQVQAL